MLSSDTRVKSQSFNKTIKKNFKDSKNQLLNLEISFSEETNLISQKIKNFFYENFGDFYSRIDQLKALETHQKNSISYSELKLITIDPNKPEGFQFEQKYEEIIGKSLNGKINNLREQLQSNISSGALKSNLKLISSESCRELILLRLLASGCLKESCLDPLFPREYSYEQYTDETAQYRNYDGTLRFFTDDSVEMEKKLNVAITQEQEFIDAIKKRKEIKAKCKDFLNTIEEEKLESYNKYTQESKNLVSNIEKYEESIISTAKEKLSILKGIKEMRDQIKTISEKLKNIEETGGLYLTDNDEEKNNQNDDLD